MNTTSSSKAAFRSFYRRKLPHLRNEDSIYFVTWRIAGNRVALSYFERDVIIEVFQHFDRNRYDLISLVVMDDHVHVIFGTKGSSQVHEIIQGWKSCSAHMISKYLGSEKMPVWQDEYFDRIVRNEEDLTQKVFYIRNNPKKRWPNEINYKWHYENLSAWL
jgi:putative transposase